MTTALAEVPKNDGPQDLIRWTPDQVGLIQRTVAKGTTGDEFKLFLYQAARTGLDPLAKQIYAIKRWNAKEQREVMAIQTGIDGFRVVADRTGKYAGSEDAVFSAKPPVGMTHAVAEKLDVSATVTVYKIVSGVRCPFTATAHWTEYYPGEKQGSMWRSKPHVMLAKCAEALALRKAFPADLSGVYTTEEMEQAGPGLVDAPPAPRGAIEPPPPAGPPADACDHGISVLDPCPACEDGEPTEAVPVDADMPILPVDTTPVITLPQRKRLFGIAKSLGQSNDDIRKEVRRITGQDSTEDLRRKQYDLVISGLYRKAGVAEPASEGR